jgi:hypothetical protein
VFEILNENERFKGLEEKKQKELYEAILTSYPLTGWRGTMETDMHNYTQYKEWFIDDEREENKEKSKTEEGYKTYVGEVANKGKEMEKYMEKKVKKAYKDNATDLNSKLLAFVNGEEYDSTKNLNEARR